MKRRRSTSDRFAAYDESGGSIADAIAELVEPYLFEGASPEEVEKLFMTGAVAWNVSLLPIAQREDAIRRFVRELLPPPRFRFVRLVFWALVSRIRKVLPGTERVGDLLDDIALERLIGELIERKERLFPKEVVPR